MRIVVSWLRELCPTDLPVEELAERLTAQGVKVEAILRPWERLSGVVVAQVVEVRDHPSSEALCVARVSVGGVEREVVVGVRNMGPGDLVPLAGPGATIPGVAGALGERKIRGVVSRGMLCSPRELGISHDHQSILLLPPDAPVGADVKELFGLHDAVLDIEVKSNRPDLLSVVGVAREAAAATGAPLVAPDTSVEEAAEKAEERATVEVRDLDGCPRYLARIISGVSIGPSPITVQARLTASGMRPLSGVVDATNYVMLELGQPMHPFDLELLAGRGIVVRRAEDGERLVTLDDVERVLTSEDLVIADHQRAVAIGGVMGSAPAEVAPSTTTVLLESAHFDPTGVLRSSRRLGLVTEASIRFGRGADPEVVDLAAARCAALMARWAGGTVLAGAVDVGASPARRAVSVRPERAGLVLGYPISGNDAQAALTRLRIPAYAADHAVEAEVPGYRHDLRIEEDLIEEVARIQGYDLVPETLPAVPQAGEVAPGYARRRRLREAFVRAGTREAVSFSFASPDDLRLMGQAPEAAVRVANPLAADQAFLRMSLLPGLLHALRHNLSRQVRGAALFEVGRVFAARDGVEEHDAAGAALAGQASSFPDPPRTFDFLDARGVLEAVMDSLGADAWSLGEAAGEPFHPGRSAHVLIGGRPAGVIGELHPRVTSSLDLPRTTAVLELDATLIETERRELVSRAIPRFPPVRRDLAFVVRADVPAGRLQMAIVEAAAGLAEWPAVFDVFSGPPIAEGRKSVAFSVDFRAPDRTMTDEEVESIVRTIAERLAADVGAELRAG